MTRIWDPYLSEQDKAHVARQPKRPFGFGSRAAVLMVDNYKMALGDRPQPLLEAIDDWPLSTGLAGWQALEKIAVLLAAARKAELPVVHTTGLPTSESGIASWAAPRPGPPLSAARERELTAIVEQAAPVEGEAVIRKAAPSAFFGTPLASHLIRLGVDTLIVAGESTSGCVRASVVDAVSYRFRVIVVEECVYDRHESAHAINLFDMDRKYADVLALDEVLRWIEKQAPQARV